MNIEQKVKQTLKKAKIPKNKKILVAISGGKDSTTTAYLLKKFGYNIEGIFIDLCVDKYSKKCLKKIEKFCEDNEIKLHVYNIKKEQGKGMKYFWKKNKELNHCAVCGVFKKWVLNREARKLKATYIATGHNLDDEVETILLNLCKGSLDLGMKTGVITQNISDRKFVPRLKPLFYCENKEVRKFAEKEKIIFIKGTCPYREDSYRIEIRDYVEGLSKKQKETVMRNFEKMRKKNVNKKTKITYCEICGEPSRRNICKKCKLVK